MFAIILRLLTIGVAVAACIGLDARPARAEATEVRVASQYGFGFLPLMVMERRALLERALAAAGLSAVKVNWATLGGGNAMNEAVLSGSLDFASSGTTAFITLWAKTRGRNQVRAVGALGSVPLWFNTRSPSVQSLRDLTGADKIAVTAVRVSVHAILLQMAAEQLWGFRDYEHFDGLTVSMSQPDGMAALLSRGSEVDNHFTAPPFQYKELKSEGVRRIASAEDILGGPATFVVAWTSEKFREENPRIFAAFFAALSASIDFINQDRPATAAIYREMSGSSDSEAEIIDMMATPGTHFRLTPENVMKYVDFMHRTGVVKTRPASWTDLFFPEAHGLHGS